MKVSLLLLSFLSFSAFAVEVVTPIPKLPPMKVLKGTRKLQCVPIKWVNLPEPIATSAACDYTAKVVADFYRKNSRGLFSYTVVPSVPLEIPWNCGGRQNEVHQAVRDMKTAYDYIVPQKCIGNPHAGGNIANVKSTQTMTAMHEVGHLVGFGHAGAYKYVNGKPTLEAYGDRGSIMGRIISRFITAPQYYYRGWLKTDEYVLHTEPSNTYVLKTIEDLATKTGLLTVIIAPPSGEGRYAFVSAKKSGKEIEVNLHLATGSGSQKVKSTTSEMYDSFFTKLHIKVLGIGAGKVKIQIDRNIIDVPTPAPTTKPTSVPTRTATILPTAAPTQTPKPTVLPTKTSAPVPTPTQTRTPTPPPVSVIPACIDAVDTNSAWAVFGPAIGQFRSYHKATKTEIMHGNKLLELMKNSKDNGITIENDKAMVAAANGIRGTLCRVTKPGDSYLLLHAKKGVSDYNGPNIIFREASSSRIVVIGPHDDSDFTHTVTKLATQRTNALATISNGQKRHVNSDSDFMHHSFNLGSKMVWKLNALYPKVVFLHTHGMANPNTVLYRSRSKILGNAYEKAVTSCTGFKSFTPRFNAYYSTEEGIRTGFYLKVENPVKFYHNRPGYLECIVKYLEANYSWAYEDVADDASDKIADIDQANSEPESEPNETPE